MPLSTEQENKIKSHLSKHSQFVKCPICSGNRWQIEPELIAHPILDAQYKMIVDGAMIPMALLSCEKCYFSLSFNAIKLGLL
jgi:hypothetical protein